jgi:hypothetical protein
MCTGQKEIKNDMSAIKSGQAELEEKVTETLDKQLKGVIMVAEQEAQELREEFSSKREGALE